MTPRAIFLALWLFAGLNAQSTDVAIQRYAEQGRRALAAHNYAEAEQAFDKLRQLTPATAEVHAQLGFIYFQERKFEQAVPALRQALKLKPTLPNTDVLLSMSLAELGRFTESLPGLEKGFRRSTDPALKRMTGLQLERAYTGLRRDDKAVEVALELNRLYPDDPEVLYQTGRLFGNFAYLSMKRLADVAPASVWRHQAAGEAYQSEGAYEDAINEYRWVLAAEPTRPGIHLRLGRVLLARSKQRGEEGAAALKEFEEELRLDPADANAAYEAAEVHRKAGRPEEARVLFETAIQHYPDFQEAQVGLGAVLVSLAKADAALPHLLKAVSLNPSDDIAFFHLAQAYKQLGNSAEQRKTLAEFRRLREQRTQSGILQRSEVTKQELDPKIVP